MKPTNTPVTSATVEIDMEHEANAERAWMEMQNLRVRLCLRPFQPVEQAAHSGDLDQPFQRIPIKRSR